MQYDIGKFFQKHTKAIKHLTLISSSLSCYQNVESPLLVTDGHPMIIMKSGSPIGGLSLIKIII